jgi:D-arabinose 1-dehydrogenase-like Zn-dependent alcohol dehydrogenase
LGGLGHLGVQFAVKMGFRTAVIARGREKTALAFKLGAHHYIDSTATDVAAALHGIRPMVEEVRLEDADRAYQRMLDNQARFRMVLTTGR